MGAERQINIQTYVHTNTHTHFSENNFSKPGGTCLVFKKEKQSLHSYVVMLPSG